MLRSTDADPLEANTIAAGNNEEPVPVAPAMGAIAAGSANNPSILSPQEELILSLAGKGFADKEIARKIGISVGTVRTYWQRMRDKTHARSRSEILSQCLHQSHSQTVDKLERGKARIAALVEASPVGLALMDESGRLSNANPAFLSLVDLTREEFESNAVDEVEILKNLGTASVIVNGRGAMLHVLLSPVKVEGKAYQAITLIPAMTAAEAASSVRVL